MPYFPSEVIGDPDYTPRTEVVDVQIKMIDHAGNRHSQNIGDVPEEATDGQARSLAEAIGIVSNAGVYEVNRTQVYKISPAKSRVYDDVYGEVGDILTLTFQNNSGILKRVQVPAPDRSFFVDGTQLKTDDPAIQDIIDSAKAILNAGTGGTYEFYRWTLSDGRGNRYQAPVKPTVAEPTVGSNPPPDFE